MATLKEAVSTLLKNGAKRVDNLVINNVNVTALENYTRVALTLDKAIEGYIRQDDDTFEKGETNVIFVSLYSLNSVMRENNDLAFAVNHISKHPDSLQIILSHAKVSVIQEPVVAGAVRTNPFTEKQDEDVMDHDAIFNHVVKIELGERGLKAIEKISDHLLGLD